MSESEYQHPRPPEDGGKWAVVYGVLALTVLAILLAAAFTAYSLAVVP